jgi:hypothetical protein
VHDVAPGLVDELSAALLEEVPDAPLIVALGGGRVIDTAKAVAAGRGGVPRVAAIPTTLSAAEMTRVHRLPAGREAQSTPVRPAIVLNDPALARRSRSTSSRRARRTRWPTRPRARSPTWPASCRGWPPPRRSG